MKSAIINIMMFIVFFLLVSCNDNRIYIDLKKQSLKSCNGQNLTNLIIDKYQDSVSYTIQLKYDGTGTNTLNLISVDPNYDYSSLFNIRSNYSLDPLSTYTIQNSSFGDAAHSDLTFSTDKHGKIIYSSSLTCK